MTGWSEEVEAEREELLHSFFDAAQSMTDTLKGAGFWADFIDPSSGKPFLSAHTNATLFETDDRFRHLGFEIEDLGCCKVVRHHEWSTQLSKKSLSSYDLIIDALFSKRFLLNTEHCD